VDLNRKSPAAAVAAFAVTLLWSSSWVLIRIGLDQESLPPLFFAALRYLLAGCQLLAWVLARPATRRSLTAMDQEGWSRLVALGLVFYAVTQGAQFVAIDNQPAATTSLTLSLTPLLVGVLASRALEERLTVGAWAGTVMAALGAGLYFGGALEATLAGMVAALVGLAANTAGALMGRSVNRAQHLPAVMVTAVSMTCGALLLGGVALAVEAWPPISLRAWVIIGWLATVNTAVAFTLWNWALRHLPAVTMAAINNTMLVQIAVLAWIFLGERPDNRQAGGILVVSLGVYLVTTRRFSSGRRTG
jgi:drug/metabolite transporter (DMT)-like permease